MMPYKWHPVWRPVARRPWVLENVRQEWLADERGKVLTFDNAKEAADYRDTYEKSQQRTADDSARARIASQDADPGHPEGRGELE